MERILLDVTVRRKAPAETIFLLAAVFGLSLTVYFQHTKIEQLEKGLNYGTVY